VLLCGLLSPRNCTATSVEHAKMGGGAVPASAEDTANKRHQLQTGSNEDKQTACEQGAKRRATEPMRAH